VLLFLEVLSKAAADGKRQCVSKATSTTGEAKPEADQKSAAAPRT
jgi:hypothetical protein